MKTLFVSLVALLFAFFIGCQDTVTDPIVNDSANVFADDYVSKDIIHYYPNVIKLAGMIDDPSHDFDSFAQIKGTVRYKIDRVFSKLSTPPSALRVKLLVNAKIKCQNQVADTQWIVAGSSEDLFYKSNANESVYYFEKSFRVQNSGGMDLVLKFRVSEEQLELLSMRFIVNEN
jgi:hypothetical protein